MRPYQDPAFADELAAIGRLEQIAWAAYKGSRKSPVTRKAGRGFADPEYALSVDWLDARDRLRKAQAAWSRKETRSRVLLVNGSPRNDGTCPGENSKTHRMVELAPGRARATAHRSRRARPQPAHIRIRTPDPSLQGLCVERHQATSVLKLMIDRLVCADGGNPDPTSTHSKTVSEAKALEMKGCAPYATSHQPMDADRALQEEVRNVARAVAQAVGRLREGKLVPPDGRLRRPRPK
jgi:hypothetical protein